jgi:hypothetical protein
MSAWKSHYMLPFSYLFLHNAMWYKGKLLQAIINLQECFSARYSSAGILYVLSARECKWFSEYDVIINRISNALILKTVYEVTEIVAGILNKKVKWANKQMLF